MKTYVDYWICFSCKWTWGRRWVYGFLSSTCCLCNPTMKKATEDGYIELIKIFNEKISWNHLISVKIFDAKSIISYNSWSSVFLISNGNQTKNCYLVFQIIYQTRILVFSEFPDFLSDYLFIYWSDFLLYTDKIQQCLDCGGCEPMNVDSAQRP